MMKILLPMQTRSELNGAQFDIVDDGKDLSKNRLLET